MDPLFSQEQLQAVAFALGDTDEGLTGTEIAMLFVECQMSDPGPLTKRVRIFNAFVQSQNTRGDITRILGFIRKALKPARYIREPQRFEPLRANVNQALAFAGYMIREDGKIQVADVATTLPEAKRRARELRKDLESRGVHPDVLHFCREELLSRDYFHAVLEAVKSVAEKLRRKTGLLDDGAALVDRALCGDKPMLSINQQAGGSAKSEQNGFANLIKGTFSMFRNPTAHEPRVTWPVSKDDAEDLLSLVSLIHRRLDASTMPPRI